MAQHCMWESGRNVTDAGRAMFLASVWILPFIGTQCHISRVATFISYVYIIWLAAHWNVLKEVEILQPSRHHCCRCAYQISERYDSVISWFHILAAVIYVKWGCDLTCAFARSKISRTAELTTGALVTLTPRLELFAVFLRLIVTTQILPIPLISHFLYCMKTLFSCWI